MADLHFSLGRRCPPLVRARAGELAPWPRLLASRLGYEDTTLALTLCLPGSDSGRSSSLAAPSAAPSPKARVVGWPPVRSYRKNALADSSKANRAANFVKVVVSRRSSASAPPAPGSHRRSLPQRVFFPSRAVPSCFLRTRRAELAPDLCSSLARRVLPCTCPWRPSSQPARPPVLCVARCSSSHGAQPPSRLTGSPSAAPSFFLPQLPRFSLHLPPFSVACPAELPCAPGFSPSLLEFGQARAAPWRPASSVLSLDAHSVPSNSCAVPCSGSMAAPNSLRALAYNSTAHLPTCHGHRALLPDFCSPRALISLFASAHNSPREGARGELATGEALLGRGGFADIWRWTEKRHLKMLVVDLKWRLNSRVDAIRKKAVEASSILIEVTTIGSPPGSVMPRVIGGDLR
uniref:Auxin-responsive protein n=1 Tax=Zea mays TaxID=4577 RepID=A0A804P0M8_MAIZE